jgi:hypothetical protein
MKLRTAQEIRRLSEQHVLRCIAAAIEAAASDGKMELEWTGIERDLTKSQLEKAGYTVGKRKKKVKGKRTINGEEVETEREVASIIISWKNARRNV